MMKGKIRGKIEVVIETDADKAAEMDCILQMKTDEEMAATFRELIEQHLLPFDKIISIKATTLVDDSKFKNKRFYGD